MEKIWLKNYPAGVPAEIDPDQYQSIVELFELNCEKYSSYPSFYNLGVTFTFKELNELSRDFAAYLQQDLLLKKGERLAIMLPNVLQYPIVLFGALRAGLTVVNVNPLYTEPELTHQLQDAKVDAIVVLENFAHIVEQSLVHVTIKNVIVANINDFFSPIKAFAANLLLKYVHRKIPRWHIPYAVSFKTVMKKGKQLPLLSVSIGHNDIAFLQYTGGTTGLAKGAMLTHRNIIANIEQGYAWFHSCFCLGKEVIITALPLYHTFSLLVNCLLYVTKVGGVNVLITNPRDVPKMIKEIAKFKFTCITGVNTLFNALLNDTKFSQLDFSQLKLSIGGGMAVQHAVAEQWQQVTGSVLLEGYGLTEASPCIAVNSPDTKSYTGTIGVPLPSTEVKILDNQGHEVALGMSGELAVKGPQVMKGYWQQQEETQKVFTKDGWLLTGDIASVDEQGRLRILERKKDMILVSGFNVYPNEIEDVLAAIPGIKEAAVIGVSDEHTGEAVKAFVVKNHDALTAEEIAHCCRVSLTAYKVPKQIVFCKELPKSNVGKILRRALKPLN